MAAWEEWRKHAKEESQGFFFERSSQQRKIKSKLPLLNRLKEAPMEERELEIVDLGGKETSEERVGFLDIIFGYH